MKEAVDTSLEHLRPWMAWAYYDPQTVDDKIDLIRGFRSRFDAGDDFTYGVFSHDEREAIGGTGLHTRVGDDAFEIGYWVRFSAVGNGFAQRGNGRPDSGCVWRRRSSARGGSR